MPEINGQTFPEYAFAEYPKRLYKGGDLSAEALTVADAEEEANAVSNGFAHVVTEAQPDPTAAPADKKGADA